ncbi:hypothetical protein C8F04DRAFT_1174621 [Mycena alexandri]|uniref:Uncharacterized protein n=1 Tax=Mycena alexandri TaxID=1745969 RepID=A0AAD6TII9_9AGAR|nr:hypothetical protein C8F04DRAFT_1174621 [Mycena alexandri]
MAGASGFLNVPRILIKVTKIRELTRSNEVTKVRTPLSPRSPEGNSVIDGLMLVAMWSWSSLKVASKYLELPLKVPSLGAYTAPDVDISFTVDEDDCQSSFSHASL